MKKELLKIEHLMILGIGLLSVIGLIAVIAFVQNIKLSNAEDIIGCGDPAYIEYNENVTVNDYSYCVTYKVYGCTDSIASNYNSSANTDDGSCSYNDTDLDGTPDYSDSCPNDPSNLCNEIIGCMNPGYLEYNPSATYDTGSSCVTIRVVGCTDQGATNYTPGANVDDGSCDYTQFCNDPNYVEYWDNDDNNCSTFINCSDPSYVEYRTGSSCQYTRCTDPTYQEYGQNLPCTNTIPPDQTPPTIVDVQVSSVTASSAQVSWSNSGETAVSRIQYGAWTSSLGSNTAYQTSATPSYVLSNLKACTKYYYRVSAQDELGNTAYSSVNNFTTTGCPGSATIVSSAINAFNTSIGGTLQKKTNGQGIELTIPVGYSNTNATFQINQLSTSVVVAGISAPSGFTTVGDYTYELRSLVSPTTLITTFLQPITISISYAAADLNTVDESSLKIYRYNGSAWSELSNCTVNTSARTVTCTTTAFSTFMLVGRTATAVPTPTVSSSSGGVPQGSAGFSSSQQSIQVSLPLTQTSSISSTPQLPIALQTFVRNLQYGMSGEDVRSLQRYLNKRGFIVSLVGPGSPGQETNYFGPATRAALTRFQNAHAQDILEPVGLLVGNGIFGESTRTFVLIDSLSQK